MPKTLLLADDSVVIQKLVGLSFANEDVEILTADNGDDAIARAREAKPDAVIADVIMPGKSGYEVCEAIKGDRDLAHIPVLLLTGTFEAFDEERAAAVGSAGHITKPFEAQALVERVKTIFANAPRPAASAPAAAPPSSEMEPTDSSIDEAFDFFDDDVAEAPAAPARPAAPRERVSATADTDPLADPFFHDPSSHAGDRLPPAEDLDAGVLGSDSTVALMPDDNGDSAENLSTDLLDLDGGAHDPGARDAMTTLVDDGLSADEDTGERSGWSMAESPAETVVADFGDVDDFGPGFATDDAADDAADDADASEPMGTLDTSDELEIGSSAPGPADDAAHTMLADELFASQPSASANPAVDLDAALEAEAHDELDAAMDTEVEPGFASEAESAARVELDPGTSAYDLSSSDLGELDVDDAAADSGVGAPTFAEPVDADADPNAASHGGTTLQGELEPDFDGDAFAPPAAPAPPVRAETAPHAAGFDVSAVMRERLHETLEKVAWEAFSELSEQVVKQVLERVETIAWEVIPQMTEAMIREEIRRMKGEDESGE